MTTLARVTAAGFVLSFSGLLGVILCAVALPQLDERRDGWAAAGVVIASLAMIVGERCG